MQTIAPNIVMKTDVESAFWKRQKIQLIKLYRDKFNRGIKDSKDAIETILPDPDHFDPNGHEKLFTKENLQKIFNLFFPSEINENNENGENRLYFAITKMKEDWQVLGYKSFKDGILSLMANF